MLIYAITMAMGSFTHATGVLVPIAHGLIWTALAFRRRTKFAFAALIKPLAACVLAGTLTLQLYAIVFPQFIDTIMNPRTPPLTYEWQNPLWLVSETLQGLARGVPGSFVSLAVGIVFFSLGLFNYTRRCATTTAVMTLPAVLLGLTLIMTSHNLWPRMFFFSSAFGALVLIRGIIVAFNCLHGRSGTHIATVAILLVIILNGSTVPNAWGPKQDYVGTTKVLSNLVRTDDAVVTVDMATMLFNNYLGLNWAPVSSVDELMRVEKSHRETYIVYTFPTRLESAYPEIWDRLQREYQTIDTKPGTLNGGEIVIKRRN
jgi:hypothetical protein